MPLRTLSLLTTTALALIAASVATRAQAQAPAALTGTVTSAAEGAMEGVVVSAKKGIVTVSVVSDAKGAFSFPAAKLGAGDYTLSIRAAGYDLDGRRTVTLADGKPARDGKAVLVSIKRGRKRGRESFKTIAT